MQHDLLFSCMHYEDQSCRLVPEWLALDFRIKIDFRFFYFIILLLRDHGKQKRPEASTQEF